MAQKYIIEFSDKESRKYDSMPFHTSINASSKTDAKKRALRQLSKMAPRNKIKIEAVYPAKVW